MTTEAPVIAGAGTRVSLVEKFAAKYSIEPAKLLATLKATAFKPGKDDPEVSNEQMAALLVVADQYGLNPFTRELFAFNDKHKGVVPIVSVDGWLRIINSHPEMNGMEFNYGGPGPDWIECIIYRKDREHPIKARELMSECKRGTGPWSSHPSRMLRHKALIQCARIAFGFAGIYDEDEAERIVEKEINSTAGGDRALGAAGAKAALLGHAAATAAGPLADADVLTNSARGTAAGAAGGEFAKSPGTQEKRDEIILAMKEAKTPDDLNELMVKAGPYDWTKPDLDAINTVYNERAADLAG